MALKDWKKTKSDENLVVFASKKNVEYTTSNIYPKFEEYKDRPKKELVVKKEIKSVINGIEYGWDVFLYHDNQAGREINKSFKTKSQALAYARKFMSNN